jgi:hypothetical protein
MNPGSTPLQVRNRVEVVQRLAQKSPTLQTDTGGRSRMTEPASPEATVSIALANSTANTVSGERGMMGLLGLCGTPETLAEQKLDGGDAGADIGDVHLGTVLLAAVGTGEGGPVLPGGPESRVEQRPLNRIQGRSRS